MKKRISEVQFRRAIQCVVLLSLLWALYAGNVSPVRADATAAQPRKIILAPATVPVSAALKKAVVISLEDAVTIGPGLSYFAISDLRLEGDWAIASVIGLAQVHDGLVWSLDDGAWAGLVLLERAPDGAWTGGVQGTPLFSSLIDNAPDTFLSATARQDLDPLREPALKTETLSPFTFPWQAGTSMFYGAEGVHDNGFSGIVSGWKAVDMLSDGDTSLGHAPNRLLAAEAGSISYKCTDANNVAVRIGDFFYTHLVDNPGLIAGATFAQETQLGQMKVGSFGSSGSGCGWAKQPSGWFHVHWGFPNADLQVEKWTLSMSTQNWTNGTTTVSPGKGWILSTGGDLCAAPALPMPADGTISTSQTIDFSWSAVTGCIFSGYKFRVKTVSTMASDGTTLVNAINTLTSRTQTISSDWDNQDLYWGVKAANAPAGAAWSVTRFRIEPGSAVPTDYGSCSDDGQHCAFSGDAQVDYGTTDHYVGPLWFTDGVDCNSTVFGSDPDPGAAKKCFIKGGRPEGSTWCAKENGTCGFGAGNTATVYYGVNGQYASKTGVVSSIACTSSTFGDPFPSLTKACYYIMTGNTSTTSTILSTAAEDGFIIESGQTSSVGGTANSFAVALKVGDDVLNRQIRSIVSFDTSVLPDTAVVTSATLQILESSQVGDDPFSTLGSMKADIKTGAFSGSSALQSSDWQAQPSKKAALAFTDAPVAGWYSSSLQAADLVYINATGPTQFRLRFAIGDNGNFADDFLKFYSGNTTTGQPKLILEYYVP